MQPKMGKIGAFFKSALSKSELETEQLRKDDPEMDKLRRELLSIIDDMDYDTDIGLKSLYYLETRAKENEALLRRLQRIVATDGEVRVRDVAKTILKRCGSLKMRWVKRLQEKIRIK